MNLSLRLVLACINVLGINALFRFINRDKAIILWYHGVSEGDNGLHQMGRPVHIGKAAFETNISYLKRRGYSFTTMSELSNLLQKNRRMRRLAVVTFDDGYENVLRNAYPIMEKMGAKGCLYVVSESMGASEMMWTDRVAIAVNGHREEELRFTIDGKPIVWKLGKVGSKKTAIDETVMRLGVLPGSGRDGFFQQVKGVIPSEIRATLRIASGEQLKSLDKDILEVGSHSRSHPDCTQLESEDELENELTGSKLDIVERVGYDVRHFCYPFGSYDDAIVDKTKKAGYETATTTVPGLVDRRSDPFKLRRIGGTADMLLFEAMVSGAVLLPLRWYIRLKGIRNRRKRWQK